LFHAVLLHNTEILLNAELNRLWLAFNQQKSLKYRVLNRTNE